MDITAMETKEVAQGITAMETKELFQGILASECRKAKNGNMHKCRTFTPKTSQRSGKTNREGDSAKSLNQICDNRHDTDNILE
jgi:hypothetical protein